MEMAHIYPERIYKKTVAAEWENLLQENIKQNAKLILIN
jgi:hypothetical protein